MQNEASGNIARVAVKAPPFWRANPQLWCKQMERQFILTGVTTEITKFHHIVSVLQAEELEVVGDIMQDPPAERPYEALRRRLCSQYAQNQRGGIEVLVSSMAAYPRAADIGYHQRQIGAISLDGRRNHGSSNRYYFDPGCVIRGSIIHASPSDGDFIRLSRLEARSRSRSREPGKKTFFARERLTEKREILPTAGITSVSIGELSSENHLALSPGKQKRVTFGPSGDGSTEIHRLYMSDRSKFLIDTGPKKLQIDKHGKRAHSEHRPLETCLFLHDCDSTRHQRQSPRLSKVHHQRYQKGLPDQRLSPTPDGVFGSIFGTPQISLSQVGGSCSGSPLARKKCQCGEKKRNRFQRR
ncbi:hypothetical protein HNY73_005257 [Argiope bruennichi]|uniref:DUF7041 domain-containing protein n=1 Tax=Argiope bruennichi TaxID=94029 RepID=A0A8T0FGU0_ARGBR|nr:hypothetical protein HNY73_005257 [Argiope bruennichi]